MICYSNAYDLTVGSEILFSSILLNLINKKTIFLINEKKYN